MKKTFITCRRPAPAVCLIQTKHTKLRPEQKLGVARGGAARVRGKAGLEKTGGPGGEKKWQA